MGNGLDMDLAGPRAGRPGHSRLRRDAVGAGRPVSAPREFFDSAANSRRALRTWGDRRGRVPTPTLRVAVTGAPISRRRALALITLGGASLAAGAAGWVAGLGAPGARGRLRPGPAGQLLTQPTVLSSRNGVLRVRLTAAADVWLAGRHTTALGFNGTSPGPTLSPAAGAAGQPPRSAHQPAHPRPARLTGRPRRQPLRHHRPRRDIRLHLPHPGQPPSRNLLVPPAPPRPRRRPNLRRAGRCSAGRPRPGPPGDP